MYSAAGSGTPASTAPTTHPTGMPAMPERIPRASCGKKRLSITVEATVMVYPTVAPHRDAMSAPETRPIRGSFAVSTASWNPPMSTGKSIAGKTEGSMCSASASGVTAAPTYSAATGASE